MPASEINGWREYFSIYPFTQEREDFRIAMLAELVNNSVQMKYFKGKSYKDFLPDYLGEFAPKEKTEEQKEAEERAYVAMMVAAGFAVMEKK